jgi:tetratricopeptide (TPR) repeat protein
MTGDGKGAYLAFDEALSITRKLLAQFPADTRWTRGHVGILERIGSQKLRFGDSAGALSAFSEALNSSRELIAKDKENTIWARDVSYILLRFGHAKVRAGDISGALIAFEESLAISRELTAKDAGNKQWQLDTVMALISIQEAISLRERKIDSLCEATSILRRMSDQRLLTANENSWMTFTTTELAKLGASCPP